MSTLDEALVVVLGSLNLDIVVELTDLPAPGETRLGHGHREECGGKGANQAVAAARAGARVAMVGAVGDDDAGRRLVTALAQDGVDVAAVRRADQPTGVALIMVDDHGENMIAVSPGANATVGVVEVDRVGQLVRPGAVLLCQLEVPAASVADAARRARAGGALVALNPSPAPSDLGGPATTAGLFAELLTEVDVLVVNESEARALTGIAPSGTAAASALRELGPRAVVVTLGANGSLVLDDSGSQHVPPFRVRAVDAVAAGDSYLGALACELGRGRSLAEAARVGAAAGALAVSRPGAQASIPRRAEIDALLAGR